MRKQRRRVQRAREVTPLPALRAVATASAASPAAVYVAGLAPGSRRAQSQALVRIAHLLGIADPTRVPWHGLTPAHVDAIRARIADGSAPATTNRVLSALRGTLRAAWRAGM